MMAFLCEICGRRYMSKKSLMRHLKSHKDPVKCNICFKLFASEYTLQRHIQSVHNKPYKCPFCNKTFRYKSNYNDHVSKHGKDKYICTTCFLEFDSREQLVDHIKQKHKNKYRQNRFLHQSAINGHVKQYFVRARGIAQDDLPQFQSNNNDNLIDILTNEIASKKVIKFHLNTKVTFTKPDEQGGVESLDTYFSSSTSMLDQSSSQEEIQNSIGDAYRKQQESLDSFVEQGSNYSVDHVIGCFVNVSIAQPLAGNSYMQLPKKIRNSRYLVNPVNKHDSRCFLYALLILMYPVKRNKGRVAQYKKHENKIKMPEGFQWPASVSDIAKFHKCNPDVSINAFYYRHTGIIPLTVSKHTERPFQCNLLCIEKRNKLHWVAITNLDSFLAQFSSKHHGSKFCKRCLSPCADSTALAIHSEKCHEVQKVIVPTEAEKFLSFRDHHKTEKAEFFIVYDTEARIVPKTKKRQDHVLLSFCYYIVSRNNLIDSKPVYYCAKNDEENVASVFVQKIMQEHDRLLEIINKYHPMNKLTPEQIQHAQQTSHCIACNKPIIKGQKIARHHLHYLPGQNFRTILHSTCNLRLRQSKEINCLAHNMNYDLKFFTAEFARQGYKMDVIAKTSQKFLSVKIKNLVFKDTLNYMPFSLERLVSMLYDGGVGEDKFVHTKKHFPEQNKFQMMLRKGVYCYTYADTVGKLENSLPPIEAFRNDLTDTDCSLSDYDYVSKVWEMFKMTKLSHLLSLYNKQDVLLLADVLNNFSLELHKVHNLEIVSYLTLSQYAQQAMLRYTGCKIERPRDINIILDLSSPLRGGFADTCSLRLGVCNNQNTPHFNPSLPFSTIFYTDATSLYPTVMQSKLPEKSYKYCYDLTINDIMSYDAQSSIGYAVCIDLHWPKELQDMHMHQCLPMTMSHVTISESQLSPEHYTALLNSHSDYIPSKKLIAHFGDLKKYIVHIELAQYFVQQGIVIDKIHYAIQWYQSAWLKSFVQKCATDRKNSTTELFRTSHKALMNHQYGKLCMNERKCSQNYSLINNKKSLRRAMRSPLVQSFEIISPHLVGVSKLKYAVKLTSIRGGAFCILELSKLFMLKSLHSKFASTFFSKGIDYEIINIDTDSLKFYLSSKNKFSLDEVVYEMKDFMDLSNYPLDHPMRCDERKGQLGTFKNEMASYTSISSCALKAKSYSDLVHKWNDPTNVFPLNRSKGTPRHLNRNFKHDLYVDCLLSRKKYTVKYNQIVSKNIRNSTVKTSRVALSSLNEKRYFLSNLVSVPHFYYRIKNDPKHYEKYKKLRALQKVKDSKIRKKKLAKLKKKVASDV